MSLNSKAQNVLPNMVSNLGVEIVSPLGNEFDFNSPSPNISLNMTSDEEFKRSTSAAVNGRVLADDVIEHVTETHEKVTPSKRVKEEPIAGNEEDNVRFLFLALFKAHELNGDPLSAAKMLVWMHNRFAVQYFSAMNLWPYFVSTYVAKLYL
jgi:hypothetical protein